MSMRSLKVAKEWLKRAKDSNALGYRDMAVVASLISMFHAARALLFRNGVSEVERQTMIEYLRCRYPELREHVTSLDQFNRFVSAIYSDPTLSVKRSDAKGAMDSAKEFIKAIEKELSKG